MLLKPLREVLPDLSKYLEGEYLEQLKQELDLELYARILEVEAKAEEEAEKLVKDYEELISGGSRRVLEEQRPLIEIIGVPRLGDEFYRKYMRKLLSLLAHKQEFREASSKLLAFLDRKPSIESIILEGFGKGSHVFKQLAEEAGVSLDFLNTVVFSLVRPVLRAIAIPASRNESLVEGWYGEACPVCGVEGSIGFLTGEGRKAYFKCVVCGFEWRIPRAKCPYCGGEPIEFYQPYRNMSWLRLYRCRHCGRFWKMVDEEEGSKNNILPPRTLYPLLTSILDPVIARLQEGSA